MTIDWAKYTAGRVLEVAIVINMHKYGKMRVLCIGSGAQWLVQTWHNQYDTAFWSKYSQAGLLRDALPYRCNKHDTQQCISYTHSSDTLISLEADADCNSAGKDAKKPEQCDAIAGNRMQIAWKTTGNRWKFREIAINPKKIAAKTAGNRGK